MQRILFLAVCLAAMATAQAQQFVPMYSEVYNEKTGALESKEWQSAEGHSRLEYPDGSVTIFRLDSMAMYWLDPAKKTASLDARRPQQDGRTGGADEPQRETRSGRTWR